MPPRKKQTEQTLSLGIFQHTHLDRPKRRPTRHSMFRNAWIIWGKFLGMPGGFFGARVYDATFRPHRPPVATSEQRALGASGSIGIFAGLGFFRSSPLRGPGTVWVGVWGWQVGWLGCFGRTTFWMKKEDLEVKNNGWDWTNTMGKESKKYICWECGYSDVNFIIFNHFHSFVGWYIF